MVTVVARWKVKKEHVDSVLKYSKPLIDLSRQEQGNIKYDLYAKSDSSNEFLIFEIYNSMDDFKFHQKTEHFIDIAKKQIHPLLESSEVSIFEDK